jgi:hypothetical protein
MSRWTASGTYDLIAPPDQVIPVSANLSAATIRRLVRRGLLSVIVTIPVGRSTRLEPPEPTSTNR